MTAPVQPGEVLAGKYQVERVLGEGGMGVVVAARHLQLDQIVALKFLRSAMSMGQATLDRFAREARNAVRLRSEHVARIMDVGTLDSGSPYIVMEYLEGSDLASVLAQRGKLPIPVAVDYVLQACDAIAEAHALGIIHRDLKPENLFVTRGHDNTSLVKVLDFGISKSTTGEFSATSSQAVLGSPAYMSPEQMRSAKLVDVRTDVWALGVILYQLVVGHVPWDGETLPMLCFRISSDPPPPFPDRQQADFQAVVWRCLEKDPERRFRSVHALAVALAPFAPPHAAPLVERIGRVLQGRADGTAAAPGDTTHSPATLREMSGERMLRTAVGSRRRRLIGLVVTAGALASAGTAAVVLGLGRGGDAVTERATPPAVEPRVTPPVAEPRGAPPAAEPQAEPRATPPAESRATPPAAASASAPVVAPPSPVPRPESASASASVVAPPASRPEPAIAPAAQEATPPARAGLPPSPSPATRPRSKERHRRPPSAAPSKPSPAAPPAAPPSTDPPRPVAPPARPAPDPLSSPD